LKPNIAVSISLFLATFNTHCSVIGQISFDHAYYCAVGLAS
jgi:hypothetical protein